jgi:glycosyltransferase involved in cell wall biosynthesis
VNIAISVVMPAHNAAPFLPEAIASILGQTLEDFELIVLDDASKDRTREIACAWARKDRRIRVATSAQRLGLSGSSNHVVSLARAPIVARMDADDIALPERLARQRRVLDEAADVVLVGALAEGIDASSAPVRPRDRWRIVRRSPFVPFPHGTMMFRRAAFDAAGGYSERAAGAEDQDLVHRIARVGRVVTLPDVLYRYRYHGRNATARADELPAHLPTGALASALRVNRYYTKGATRLWSGARPGVIRDVVGAESRSWHPRYAAILAWAIWGEVSPSSLRGFLRGLTAARDRACGLWLRDGVPYEWRSAR